MGFTKGDPPRDNRPRARTNREQCEYRVWKLIEARGSIATSDIFCGQQLESYDVKEINWALDELRDAGKIVCDLEEGYARVCDHPRAKPDHSREIVDQFANREQALLSALGKIERKQAHLDEARQEFKQLLDGNPKLAEIWQRFERNGGVCVEQLKEFFKGTMRPRATRRVGNLRLISDQQAKIVHTKLRHDDDDGPNAA
jgi:hypothetical protein